MINQLGSVGQIVASLIFFLFIIIYFRYSFFRMVGEMEAVAEELEGYTEEAGKLIAEVCSKAGAGAGVKERIREIFDFFMIPPVSLDPYGILKKLEHILDISEEKFRSTAREVAPECDEVTLANITSLLKGGVALSTMAKIVRHYVEFVKKTNNFQLAMLFHMNLPLIKKVAKAQSRGIKAIAEGKPIGDGIGPLVAARLMSGEVREVARDVVVSDEHIAGHEVIVVKAKGPGATLGKLGSAVKKLAKEHAVGKIITVDATLKMEGEATGKVVSGVGAAIGDPGPEKAKIEEVAVELGIPLEAIGIKMSAEEAVMPMLREIYAAVPEAVRRVEKAIAEVPEDKAVIVVGVGNTSGIGNSSQEVRDVPVEEREKEEEKLSGIDRIAKWLAERTLKAEKSKREEAQQ